MNKRLIGGRYLTRLLQLVLGTVFVLAGGLKAVDPAQFAVAVGHYRILPPGLVNLVALTLPGVEVLAGALLVSGVWCRAAAAVIAILNVMFFGVIVAALTRGLIIECGCFGTVGGGRIGWESLVLDATLMGLAAWLIWRLKHVSNT